MTARQEPSTPPRPAWRWPILLVLPLLLGLAVVVQQRAADDTTAATTDAIVDPARLMPVAQRKSVASSTFFCAGGTATGTKEGFAEHVITVANLSDQTRFGYMTIYFDKAEPTRRPFEVAANGRLDARLSEVAKADYAAAVVEVAGGEIAVEHSVSGPTGTSVATCASAPADRWFFPTGSTRPGARLVLAVFNPFPDEAVLDITFETEDGARSPGPFSPLVVPAGRVVGVDVTPVVTLRQHVATTIVARPGSGRVVVDQIQSFDGRQQVAPEGTPPAAGPGAPAAGADVGGAGAPGTTVVSRSVTAPVKDPGLKGLSVSLGAPVPTDTWLFPEGPALEDGIDEQYVIMNPGRDTVAVEVQPYPDDQGRFGTIEPYEVTIRPGQYAAVSFTEDQRVPRGVGHWTSVVSRGGPVVAARTVTAVGAARSKGYSTMVGSPLTARRWLVAGAKVEGAANSWVVLVNPSLTGRATAEVRVSAEGRLQPIERYERVELGPGGRLPIPVTERNGGRVSVRVEADQPVLVEQQLSFDGNTRAGALGEPVIDSVVEPVPDALVPPDVDPTVTSSPGLLVDPGGTTTTAAGTGTTVAPGGGTGR